VALPSLG
jgi:hypothetical protein